jgi:transcriptional regulator with XRE-family HTH domain
MNRLLALGERFKAARKQRFPNDTLSMFALRLGVSRATLQKVEQGDMSVAMGTYYKAARLTGLDSQFDQLFTLKEDLFKAYYGEGSNK